MIKFGQKAAPHVDAAKKAGIRRVADWVEEALPEEEQDETHVMVNQIECAEEGCPPVECVIALLRKPKLLFKIFKPVADVTQEEAVGALNKALAEEKGEKQADAHDHGHQDASKAGGCEDGCCGDDHGHGHEDEHGHAEKSAKHSDEHGHDDHSGCCGGEHEHDEHDHSEHGHAEHGHDSK